MSLPNNPTFDFALSGVSSNLTLGKGGPRVSSDGTNVQLLNTSGQPGNLTINQGFFANIGIGTAAISYPLDVWGNIHLGNTTTTSGIIFPDGTFQTTAVTGTPPGGSNGWVQFNQNNTFGASQNFVFDNANVRLGIGTSYPSNTLNVWGNLQISNVNGLTSGILFPDGTFQDTATQNTPSFGSVGTIQLAGVNNTFSGDSTHLSWDSAALALNTSNIVISSPSGNITGAYTIAANIFTGNSSTISGNSSVGGNLSVYGNLFVGGVVTFSNIAIEQDLRVNSLTSNTYVQAGTQLLGNTIFSNTTIQSQGLATVNQLIANANVYGANLNIAGLAQVNSLSVNTATSTASLNVGAGGALVNSLISNNNITGATLDILGAAEVNSLISNTTIQSIGTATVNALYSNGIIQAAGNLTVGGVNSNGTIVGSQLASNSSIQAATFLYANEIYSNSYIHAGGTITGNAIKSNTFVHAIGEVVGGSLISNSTIQAAGTAIVNALISNNNVFGTSLQTSGRATVSDLVSNTNITAATLAAYGNVQVGALISNSTIQADGTATVNALVSNTNVFGATLQSSGTSNLANLVVNTNITTQVVNVTAEAWLNDVISNNNITTATLNTTGVAQVHSLISNTSIQAIGGVTVDSLTSNTNVNASSANIANDLYAGSLNVNGTAQANLIISNTGISTQTLTASGLIVGEVINSNTTIQSAGTTTVNQLISNTTVTAGNGLIATAGGLRVTGNTSIAGNAYVSGNLYVAGNIIAVAADQINSTAPIIFVANANPGDVWDLGIVGSYVTDNHYYTGVVRDYINGAWTVYDTGIFKPNITVDWTDPSLTYGGFIAGNINAAGQTASINSETGSIIIYGAGGLGVGGAINAGDQIATTAGLNIGATATVNALISNTSIQATGDAVLGTVTSNSSIQAAGTATVNALVSNTSISADTLQVTNGVVVNSLVSNTEVGADSVFASYGQFGNIRTDWIYSNLGIQTDSRVTARWVESNTYVATQAVFANNLQSTGPINGAYIFANVFIQSNGQLIADTINSNNTIQSAGVATVGGLYSNSTIQSAGVATVSGLYSNSTIQSISSVTVGSLTSNAAIQAAGSITAQDLRSNSTIVSAGTTTVNALVSNTIIQATGNATVGNLTTSGTITTTGSSGNIIGVNTLFTIDVQSSGNITTQHLISNANVGIGTVIAEYPLDVYGNIHIGNTTPTSGIIFSDGSFQSSAASATKSFGQQYTMQFAGTGNTFSGDSSNLLWDAANLSLFTSNISVHDSASIGGAINLSGNLNGSNTTIVTAKTGTFIGGLNGFGAIYAGLQDWTNYQPNTVALFTGNANAQTQINVHNESNGGSASTDIVATANNGTATDTYIDLGINSSGYNQATIDRANDGYLFVHGNAITGGGNLVLGTVSNNDIIFLQGGATAGNEVARFAYGLGLRIESNLSVSNAAVFDNNITVAANSTFDSNLTVNGNIITVGNGIFQQNLSAYSASIGSFDQINSRGAVNVEFLQSNGYVSGNTWVVDGNAHTSTSSMQQVIDSWPTASFRTAHYMLQITDTTAAAYQASQIMLLQDGTDVYLTEYADIYTATSLGSWSADISSGIVELRFTPNTSDNMNIKVVRTTIDL